MDKNKRPTKLTLTYEDGSSESWDTFIAVIAEGLIPGDIREGVQTYMSSENMQTLSISRIVGDSALFSTFLASLRRIIKEMMDTLPPNMALSILLDSLRMENNSGENLLYSETKIIDRHPEEN